MYSLYFLLSSFSSFFSPYFSSLSRPFNHAYFIPLLISRCPRGLLIQIQIPNEKEEGDYLERAVPETMRHVVREGKLVSGVLEHAG